MALTCEERKAALRAAIAARKAALAAAAEAPAQPAPAPQTPAYRENAAGSPAASRAVPCAKPQAKTTAADRLQKERRAAQGRAAAQPSQAPARAPKPTKPSAAYWRSEAEDSDSEPGDYHEEAEENVEADDDFELTPRETSSSRGVQQHHRARPGIGRPMDKDLLEKVLKAKTMADLSADTKRAVTQTVRRRIREGRIPPDAVARHVACKWDRDGARMLMWIKDWAKGKIQEITPVASQGATLVTTQEESDQWAWLNWYELMQALGGHHSKEQRKYVDSVWKASKGRTRPHPQGSSLQAQRRVFLQGLESTSRKRKQRLGLEANGALDSGAAAEQLLEHLQGPGALLPGEEAPAAAGGDAEEKRLNRLEVQQLCQRAIEKVAHGKVELELLPSRDLELQAPLQKRLDLELRALKADREKLETEGLFQQPELQAFADRAKEAQLLAQRVANFHRRPPAKKAVRGCPAED